jgi:hypothetical protein
MKKLFKGILLLAIIGCFAGVCFAQDEITGTTEITGYYQQYRNFSFDTGYSGWDFAPTRLSGGGFSVAQNLADWFAIWTQLSFYGTVNQGAEVSAPGSVRIIHNLQGIRYQTKQYGPLQFYGKAGAGIVNYSFSLYLPDYGYYDAGWTKFSAGYGGGAHVWFHKNIGITLDLSHNLFSTPNIGKDLYDTNLKDREKFDSGLAYTAGLTFRF